MGAAYVEFTEYQLLRRALNDQSIKNSDDTRTAKENKEISPGSLQNPSDPEATYREKAGQDNIGYVGNVVETCGNGNSVITDYQFESNRHSDSHFCSEVIETLGPQETPVTLISDGAFGSANNEELAKENNITLVVTSLTGREPSEIHSEFQMNDNGTVVNECPAGHEPLRQSYNQTTGACRIVMDKECCENCPYKEQCKAKMQKKTAVINISIKMVHRSRQLKSMNTEEFKAYSRIRNGVEAIPSLFRRKYRVDTMPVRGRQKMKLFFGFKIGAINFKKLLKFQRAKCAQISV
jgi:hypothetical protein